MGSAGEHSLFQHLTQLASVDAEHIEDNSDGGRYSISIAIAVREQREQQVLGPNMLVMQPGCFLARLAEHTSQAIRELQGVHGREVAGKWKGVT
jgi:hypothetical protein